MQRRIVFQHPIVVSLGHVSRPTPYQSTKEIIVGQYSVLHAQFLHFITDLNKVHYNPHLSISLGQVVEDIIIPLDSFVGNFRHEGPCDIELLHLAKDFNDGKVCKP